jgi:hypothetical protein|tara:strand:+ start:931 stop:1506 length:576 start_codon:yes stop_codon:yes gene_type:complete
MNGFLSGLILFSSFAMRTPNNPDVVKDDYEISIGFKTDKIYLKRDWERELGNQYVDDELWFEWTKGILYVKPQYVNKTSRSLKYGKMDTRYKKEWFSIGHTALYSDDKIEQGTSIGIHKKKSINDHLELETKFDGYYFRDEVLDTKRFDMQDYVSLNWKVSDKLTLSNIFDYNDIKDKKYYKFKIGLEYKL